MVQNEYEYIEFLVQEGLQDNSAYSYGRYLEAVSTHLNIVIGFSSISSEEDVESIIEQLSETDLAQNYKNNCGTALRAYLRFVSEVEPAYKSPDEIENPDQYVEGAKKKITVNSYERDNDARNKCIEIHGVNCAVCGKRPRIDTCFLALSCSRLSPALSRRRRTPWHRPTPLTARFFGGITSPPGRHRI